MTYYKSFKHPPTVVDGIVYESPFPAGLNLLARGPWIEVIITNPADHRSPDNLEIIDFSSNDFNIPVIRCVALLDTGANICIANPNIISNLNLEKKGERDITALNSKVTLDCHAGVITLPWGYSQIIEIASHTI